MERKLLYDVFVRGSIFIVIFLSPTCVGLRCMYESDPIGRYTVIGGTSGTWSEGYPSGTEVQVSLHCNEGALAQPPVVTECVGGRWTPPWPRCQKPCAVPEQKRNMFQFINGLESMPISKYTSPIVPDGTLVVARCYDPGKFRLSGDQRRTCVGGEWTGEEPQCHSVSTKVMFYHAQRHVDVNGTVVVFVHEGEQRKLKIVCGTKSLVPFPKIITPLPKDKRWHTHWYSPHKALLQPISTDFSGTYTCEQGHRSHSVNVLFKAAECKAPSPPEDGSYSSQPSEIYRHDSTIIFRNMFNCREDYGLIGSTSSTCLKGQWTHDPPRCRAIRCPEITAPDNAIMYGVVGYGRSIGDGRIFHCKTGYALLGATNQITCLEGGVWSAEPPTCEAIVIHVPPCEVKQCESWERCEVTGPSSARCGCIAPSSCLTFGPQVCGTDGNYYTSKCHLKAGACVSDSGVDVADDNDPCIYGVPTEAYQLMQADAEETDALAYDSSSSFEIHVPETQPTVASNVDSDNVDEAAAPTPAQAHGNNDTPDYSSLSYSSTFIDQIGAERDDEYSYIDNASIGSSEQSTPTTDNPRSLASGGPVDDAGEFSPSNSSALPNPAEQESTSSYWTSPTDETI